MGGPKRSKFCLRKYWMTLRPLLSYLSSDYSQLYDLKSIKRTSHCTCDHYSWDLPKEIIALGAHRNSKSLFTMCLFFCVMGHITQCKKIVRIRWIRKILLVFALYKIWHVFGPACPCFGICLFQQNTALKPNSFTLCKKTYSTLFAAFQISEINYSCYNFTEHYSWLGDKL